ncbi:MAG: tyrosine-type recombinase/integrase [Caldilineales bacterium]|nr:tyrosine-type recombinase/integrase [Caldilineales bacterium]
MSQQLDLFDDGSTPQQTTRSESAVGEFPSELTEESTLSGALGPYQMHMRSVGFSDNTVKAFMGDLRLLGRYFKLQDENPQLGDIGTDTLNQFLYWLRFERVNANGELVPCSPKSYARRVTTLKAFFGWLTENEILDADPAAAVIQESVQAPLPRILYDDEIDRLVRVTRDQLFSPTKPDARPYLLVSLLLQAGLKKSEVMNITVQDIDTSNPREPVLYVRYTDPRQAHKERKIALGPGFMPVLNQYLRAYRPSENLFECTARNLEYILADAAKAADIPGGASFEALRWTSAVRSYRYGASPEALREKLGLSPITWRETFEKIKKLARPGL